MILKHYILLSLLLSQLGLAQHLKNLDKVQLNPKAMYLVTRGTTSKGAIIANQFNLSDRCSTHVGIGIVENGYLKIFHVTNEEKDSPSALAKETVQRFVDVTDAEYLSIWECQTATANVALLRNLLYSYFGEKIAFDFNFNDEDDENMYCSEFCVKVLKKLNSDFNFPLVEIQLDSFYSLALGRETLKYWPVDFFQRDGNFVKIYETWIY